MTPPLAPSRHGSRRRLTEAMFVLLASLLGAGCSADEKKLGGATEGDVEGAEGAGATGSGSGGGGRGGGGGDAGQGGGAPAGAGGEGPTGGPAGGASGGAAGGAGGAGGGGPAGGCSMIAGKEPMADIACGGVIDGPSLVAIFGAPTTLDANARPECLFGFGDGTKGGVSVFCGDSAFAAALAEAQALPGGMVDTTIMFGSKAFSATGGANERRLGFVTVDGRFTAVVRVEGPLATSATMISLASSVQSRLGTLP